MLRRLDGLKILYVATERRAAEAAARTLRGIARNVTLEWTQTSGAALRWIHSNHDADAVIVVLADAQQGNAFLEQVRGLGVTTPVAVIAPEHLEGLLAAFNAGLDAAVGHERNTSTILEARLAEIEEWRRQTQQRVVEGQAQHDAALTRTNKICTALQERLLELEAAIRTADERHLAQLAATERLARRETDLSAAAAEAAAARAALERQLADAETAHQHDQQRAAAALAAAGERHASVENRLTRETAARATLEERLAEAETARQEADQKHATELASLTARLVEREAQHTTSSSRLSKVCTALQERLLELESAIHTAGDRHTADAAAAERLAAREADLAAGLAEAIAARSAIERQLSEAETGRQRQRGGARFVRREASRTRGSTQRTGDRAFADRRAARGRRDRAPGRRPAACSGADRADGPTGRPPGPVRRGDHAEWSSRTAAARDGCRPRGRPTRADRGGYRRE